MKYADRRLSPAAVIIGDDEIAAGTVTIKDLDLGRELAAGVADNRAWRAERPGPGHRAARRAGGGGPRDPGARAMTAEPARPAEGAWPPSARPSWRRARRRSTRRCCSRWTCCSTWPARPCARGCSWSRPRAATRPACGPTSPFPVAQAHIASGARHGPLPLRGQGLPRRPRGPRSSCRSAEEFLRRPDVAAGRRRHGRPGLARGRRRGPNRSPAALGDVGLFAAFLRRRACPPLATRLERASAGRATAQGRAGPRRQALRRRPGGRLAAMLGRPARGRGGEALERALGAGRRAAGGRPLAGGDRPSPGRTGRGPRAGPAADQAAQRSRLPGDLRRAGPGARRRCRRLAGRRRASSGALDAWSHASRRLVRPGAAAAGASGSPRLRPRLRLLRRRALRGAQRRARRPTGRWPRRAAATTACWPGSAAGTGRAVGCMVRPWRACAGGEA